MCSLAGHNVKTEPHVWPLRRRTAMISVRQIYESMRRKNTWLRQNASRTLDSTRGGGIMRRRTMLKGLGAVVSLPLLGRAAYAEDAVKIGLILPMTGQSASTGKQIDAAVKLYMAQHGDSVAGRKIQVILKDDTGVADVTKRLAQELIV